jgi:hypothetical protein
MTVRRAASAVTVLAAASAMLVAPVLARPVAQAHAVAPHVAAINIAPTPATNGLLGETLQPRTHTFNLVGATWRRGSLDAGAASLQVRVRNNDGWSGWRSLAATDGGADGGTADARRAARVQQQTTVAEPLYVGSSQGVQARVVGAGQVPADLHVLLVDGGTSAADSNPDPVRVWGGSVANAEQVQPQIYTRADWGADESLRQSACPSGPTYSPTIKMGFLHHTDSGNGYTRGAVPGIIRSIYAYHVKANGWCDIGYNYLVDRFGRIWEGRYGGITKNVLGAHTGGFNYDSFGVSMIGTFTSSVPSAALLSSVEQLFAWRLGGYYLDPKGTSTMIADSFSGSRYRAGSTVTLKTVSGHRDADTTTCPGNAAYARLPDIRSAVIAAMGAGFVAPAVDATSAQMDNGSFTVTAGAIASQNWTLTVTDSTGVAIQSVTGTASRSVPVNAVWNLTDSTGAPVLPGSYTLTLSGADANGDAALPWSTTVSVAAPFTASVLAQTSLNAGVWPIGRGIPGHTIAVSVSAADGTTQPVGSFPVSGNGRWSAASAPVTADRDLTWMITDPAISNFVTTKSTKVGPTVLAPTTDPTFVPAGSSLTVSGTALPGASSTVQLVTAPAAGGTATTSAPIAVDSTGNWSTEFTPTAPTSYWVVDSRNLTTAPRLVYPVAAASATAPGAGYAGRTVTLSGNAGNAPVKVTVAARQPGGQWTTVRKLTAKASGRFSASVPLADAAGQATAWRVTTGFGRAASGSVSIESTFPPTVTGATRTTYRRPVTLSGTAVPGDAVTVWSAKVGTPVDGPGWVNRGSTVAASDDSWSTSLRFGQDVAWRVTSASGSSAAGSTVIVPSITAPSRVVSRSLAVISGTAIPGQQLVLYRRVTGTTTWTADATLVVAADGTWFVRRHPTRSLDYRAVSDGQTSRIISIGVE